MAEPRRLASLPPPAMPRVATDAPPIVVLRAGPQKRYAQVSRVHAAPQLPSHAVAAQPLLNVIRGARPRPGYLPYVQPGALILHIPNR